MMIDYTLAREKMVDNQIRTMDVTDHPVLDAFASVPREAFVPTRLKELAYIDEDLEIAAAHDGRPARYVMEPAQLARLIEKAGVRPGDVVLDVGCGTGYAAAILSQLASSVVALEEDEDLAEKATATLLELGCDNVAVVTGPLEEGYAPESPYDAIIFSGGAVEVLPESILNQLRDGGRLVVVEGMGNAARAQLYIRDGDATSHRELFNSAVKPLPGFRKARAFEF